MLFFVTVVPCLPLVCIIVVLLQQGSPVHHHTAASLQRNTLDVIPKEILNHVRKSEVDDGLHVNFEHLTHKSNALVSGIGDIDPELLRLSENPDIEARGKVQIHVCGEKGQV